MESAYPLTVIDHRRLPEDFDGNVFVWDIDKTYLATRFSSMRHLFRIPLEFAVDKNVICGMPQVLQGIRRGPGPAFACAPLYFVTASPPQMRPVIERRMLLDGVDHDGIVFKDWSAVVRSLHPRRLREQGGFKVNALLRTRWMRPRAIEYLFGDDYESDAEAYWIYARIVSGELSAENIDAVLESAGVQSYDRSMIKGMMRRLQTPLGAVARIFIHLEKGTPPDAFERYGGKVTPVRGAFQLAVALRELGLVDSRTVRETAAAVRSASLEAAGLLDDLLADALERHIVSPSTARALEL